jgi:hypothetical protein
MSMDIQKTYQYNQSIGKYKLLSSTAGVGSIITTRMGIYVLVSDINKWRFVQRAQAIISDLRSEPDDRRRYEAAKEQLPTRGLVFVDDARFVAFLRQEKGLDALVCLIAIPDIALSDSFNSPKWGDHPINQLLNSRGERSLAEDFMVVGTHFPKWFRDRDGLFQDYSQWKALWVRKHRSVEHFAPPRDAERAIRVNGADLKMWFKNADEVRYEQVIYEPLTQINLALICPNGHLSDVPWPKFLRWRHEVTTRIRSQQTDKGADLFNDQTCEQCCPAPRLQWTESKTRSEGYGSIFLECRNCGMGSGAQGQPKISLEGINNLKPWCPGHKPWEIATDGDSHMMPRETCMNVDGIRPYEMQIALVTGNNVYFADTFSSIYIPEELIDGIHPDVKLALQQLEAMHRAVPNFSKEQLCHMFLNAGFLTANDIRSDDPDALLATVKDHFLGTVAQDAGLDLHERYRLEEYLCFTRNGAIEVDRPGLRLKDIELPEELSGLFRKVQQIEELRVTQVQLDFTRVRPKERIRRDGVIVESTEGQDIYSVTDTELFVLPANASYGEGLFFEFDEAALDDWAHTHHQVLSQRFRRFDEEVDLSSQGASFKQKIREHGWKHFVVHSFSHMMMRELEFSCGYPTASLKERLYISRTEGMHGILIYTADGSEGSMGGLVWQGQPANLVTLISKALRRSVDCSSDPLCWESEGQGLFDLNLAACFSCSLVSETACEDMNLGLDRSVLVDEDFGFFRDLILHGAD